MSEHQDSSGQASEQKRFFGPFGVIPPIPHPEDEPSFRNTGMPSEDNVNEQWTHRKKKKNPLDKKIPLQLSKTILFFCQVILIYGVVTASIVNLGLEPEGSNRDLWSALLFSSIGYLLPSPSLKSIKPAPHSS